MGLQSLVFYVLIAWLPEIVMQLALLPFTFIIPIVAGRMSDQRLLVSITSILLITGILGLLYGGSSLIVLWIVLIGIGGGCAFGLAMMFFGLRTETAHQAPELSGMAQSFGYLLAAIGPMLFG